MTFNNLPAIVMGLALIASLGGCCTSGSCGLTPSPAVEQVYSTPVSDCGCGCSAVVDSGMSHVSTGTEATGQSYNPSSVTGESTVVGNDATSSALTPTPVVEVQSTGQTPGFTAGSSSKAAGSSSKENALPGNLLPGN